MVPVLCLEQLRWEKNLLRIIVHKMTPRHIIASLTAETNHK